MHALARGLPDACCPGPIGVQRVQGGREGGRPRVVVQQPGAAIVLEAGCCAAKGDDRPPALHVVQELDRESTRSAAGRDENPGGEEQRPHVTEGVDLDHPQVREARGVLPRMRGDDDR